MELDLLKLLSVSYDDIIIFWGLRGMVLLSLSLQIVLTGLGSRRKYTANHWIAFLIWSIYLLANWIATVSLSSLLKGEDKIITIDDKGVHELHGPLTVFWIPFLLLHLGGPDTIAAYALEDNELWLRHLLGLVIQVGMALYVYFSFQINGGLKFLAIPIFIAGMIKYGERIWILWSARSKQSSKSLFSASAPKPSRQYPFEQGGSTFEEPDPFEQGGSTFEEPEELEFYLTRKGIIPQSMYLHEAYLSYKMFIPLFSNLTLRFYKDLEGIFMTLKHKSTTEAFKVVDTELGFLHDVLYTKSTVLHSFWGSILRFICFLSYVSALLAFLLIFGLSADHNYHRLVVISDIPLFISGPAKVDFAISYLLLGGAILLDIYAAIAHVLSNWTMLWLTNYKNGLASSAYVLIASLHVRIYSKWESRSMAQHNLIKFCLEAKATKFIRVEKILDIYNNLRKFRHTTWKDVKVDMRDFIYSHILEKYERYQKGKLEFEFLKHLLAERGDHVLKEVYKLDFSETTSKVEFGHSLLVWHIATDLCYYDDHNKYSCTDFLETNGEISKSLSDYLLYLLVMRPGMMPKGITDVRYRDTCAEVLRVFQDGRNLDSEARMILLDLPDSRVEIGELSDKSVLYDGVRLAKKLQLLLNEQNWELKEKWKMISTVWVEMLTYAASHCEWKEHCQQLRRGGELLTHVCLLMAHFGLSPQIRFEDSSSEDRKAPWNWESLNHMAYYLA